MQFIGRWCSSVNLFITFREHATLTCIIEYDIKTLTMFYNFHPPLRAGLLVVLILFSIKAHAQLTLEIISPASAAREFEIGVANYGSNAVPCVEGRLQFTSPSSGCSSDTSDLTGKIALSHYGTCEIVNKAFHAQQAGAIGAILCNTIDETINLSRGTIANKIKIPHISLRKSDCQTIDSILMMNTVVGRIYFKHDHEENILWGDSINGGDFNENFIQSGWATMGISDTSHVWTQADEPLTRGACGEFLLMSPTSHNGAIFLDGDHYLTDGIDCDNPDTIHSELISPLIDCSGFNEVKLRFWQFNLPIGIDEHDNEQGTTISWSLDGGRTYSSSAPISTMSERNVMSIRYANSERVVLNIPEAVNQDSFRFKFIYRRARGFYHWMIDDVALISTSPDHEISILHANSPFYSYVKSFYQRGYDTLNMVCNVKNRGALAAEILTTVKLVDEANTKMFELSDVRHFAPHQKDTIHFQIAEPRLDFGKSKLIYNISYTDTSIVDLNYTDNQVEYETLTSIDIYAKEESRV